MVHRGGSADPSRERPPRPARTVQRAAFTSARASVVAARSASGPTGAPIAPLIQRSGVSLPCRAIRSNSGPTPRLLQVPLDLEGDEVADRVVGQVEDVVDHVRVDAEDRPSPSRRRPARSSGSRRPRRSRASPRAAAPASPRGARTSSARRPCPRARRRRSPPSPRRSSSVASAAALRVGVRETEQLEVALLEDEGERLGEGGVRHAREQRVVDVVQREDLLDVVAELVDGDVVALVVHAVRADARAQVRPVAAAGRAPGVARAARRVDDDVRARPRAPAPRRSRARAGCAGCPSRTPRASGTSSA